MSQDFDYTEYAGELSLALLGVSASYFISLSNPITLIGLLFLPVLYGYTAYISREGFNYASLMALVTAIFGIVGGITAVVVVAYSLGNIMVSAFSGGVRFKDFYGATSLPLLLTGLIIGVSIFAYGAFDQQFKQQTVNQAGEKVAEITDSTIDQTGMIENQKQSQLRLVNATSKSTTNLVIQKVYNESQPSESVAKSLDEAREDVPTQVYELTEEEYESKDLDISARIESMFSDTFSGPRFVMVIPVVAGFLYSLQPLIGILTAVFGKIFALFGSRIET